MKNVIHKRRVDKNTNIFHHICGNLVYRYDDNNQAICCSPSWKKVTCKKCLKLRKVKHK